MNRKRYGDAAELSYAGYARVNSSAFSLALKVPRVLAVLVFTVCKLTTNREKLTIKNSEMSFC